MSEFWNQRYRTDTYVYGKLPNAFFREQLQQLEPGHILLPGEGEGRNAVFAAGRGWDVTAFDTSSEGRSKALRLATETGVEIRYDLAPYLGFEYSERYDAVGLFFTHQPAEMRKPFHRKIFESLKPGGVIILETFHKNQVNRNTGGPRNTDLLFSEEELLEDFPQMEMVVLQTLIKHLDEGHFHQGEAVIVQMVARKNQSL
jgi:SAM-dependent methyltransferase